MSKEGIHKFSRLILAKAMFREESGLGTSIRMVFRQQVFNGLDARDKGTVTFRKVQRLSRDRASYAASPLKRRALH